MKFDIQKFLPIAPKLDFELRLREFKVLDVTTSCKSANRQFLNVIARCTESRYMYVSLRLRMKQSTPLVEHRYNTSLLHRILFPSLEV